MDIYRLQYQRGYASLDSLRGDAARYEYAQHVQTNHGDSAVLTDWRGLDLYVVQPSLRLPDFFWWGYYVVCRTETFARIADVVALQAIPLPVRIEDMPDEYVLLFVTNVLHVTRDDEIRAWHDDHGWHHPMPYWFERCEPNRPQLFTNATFMKGQMLCATNGSDDEADFFVQCRKRGLTGIDFILLKETPQPTSAKP